MINMTKTLKDTIFLPKTNFPMQGNLAKNDPQMLKYWQDENIYQKLREKSKNRKKFILHSGPPYANGHLHMGHALNGVLKDVITKCYQMSGYDAPLVMGWDCHGLPIEWKIEENYLKEGKPREHISVTEFLKKCRDYATEWRDIQKSEFRELGIIFDYENPYYTTDRNTEVCIYKEFLKILKSGYVYRDTRPVMWSVVEKTALAEAELEYHDKISDAIYVKFPVVKTNYDLLKDACVVIWTTTPWTIPANKAIAYNPDFKYSLLQVGNNKLLIADVLVESFTNTVNITEYEKIAIFSAKELLGTVCHHPLRNLGFDSEVPLLPADYVTADTGSGLVHIAPGHGLDDFNLGKRYGLSIECAVNDDGTLKENLPYFKGEHIFKVNPKVISALEKSGNLISASKIVHSYPHSWRSKAPLIFRTTTQWFISVAPIREKLIEEIKHTKWHPSSFINRIIGMVEKRPDWCISRQRLWGVPIALFINKKTNDVLMDDDVFDRIINTFRTEGIESWRTKPAQYFLGDKYNADNFEQVMDTIEVWFDSGCSHKYVIEEREEFSKDNQHDLQSDLYFEGSDQHRGWFQSSLIESVLTTGKAPYKQVATHGFLVDQNGRKMSKSLGNVIAPTDITSTYGVDILRLWCVSGDYSEDMRVGPDIIKHQQDIYRRFRNTLRYLLGIISDNYEPVEYSDLSLLEKFILHRLYELNALLTQTLSNLNFQNFYSELHAFCTNDLSAFYFDVRKDCIYCDSKSNKTRCSTLTVISEIFNCLVRWLAPVLSFTAEEAWHHAGHTGSIHLEDFALIPSMWHNPQVAEEMAFIQSVRKIVLGALEKARNGKVINSSLEAEIIISTADEQILQKLQKYNWNEFLSVSSINIDFERRVNNESKIFVTADKSKNSKCERCWNIGLSVLQCNSKYGNVQLCKRCREIIK